MSERNILSEPEAEEMEAEMDAIRQDVSISGYERLRKLQEIEDRYLRRAADAAGLKKFQVRAILEFGLAAESREKAEEQALGLFDFDADVHQLVVEEEL
ncbi:MAG: hypothetical protein ABFS46_15105 [Myxococcota bacterium]